MKTRSLVAPIHEFRPPGRRPFASMTYNEDCLTIEQALQYSPPLYWIGARKVGFMGGVPLTLESV